MSVWDDIKVQTRQTVGGGGGVAASTTNTTQQGHSTISTSTNVVSTGSTVATGGTQGSQAPELQQGLPEPLQFRYLVDRKIGRGAFGVAYVVSERATGEKYVAKVMKLGCMKEKDLKHLKSEIDCLSLCQHPNIIRHKESYTDTVNLVLITEFADGGDLGREIATRRNSKVGFEVQEVSIIICQLGLALSYLWSKNILHRDVKPANIFLMRNGLVKLGDFGFSKHYEDTISNPVGTTLCGTPYYMSPEMWLGEHYSKAADLWAMGIVLYEMIMLERPFQGSSMKDVSDAVCHVPLPPMTAASRFDPSLIELCQRLLSKQSSQRPSMMEVMSTPPMQKALQTILDIVSHPDYGSLREELVTSIKAFLKPK